VPLDNNEAAYSIAVVPFSARSGELHLVVGTAQDTKLEPRSCTSGFLRTYKFIDDGASLELLHKVQWYTNLIHLIPDQVLQTETDDVPLAIMAFQGKLAAGVGKALRLYDIGKKKLLRKVENKVCCLRCGDTILILMVVLAICLSYRELKHPRLPHHCGRHARIHLLCCLQST
jgi:splicing factor 3B subunit 3